MSVQPNLAAKAASIITDLVDADIGLEAKRIAVLEHLEKVNVCT